MHKQNHADIALLKDVTKIAGDIALKYFRASNEVWMKKGNSPVSQADFAVNDFLLEQLRGARPDYGWMSEENEDDQSRMAHQRTFIVDPIDGTRGFIEGVDEWCISIAIVENNQTVAAILHAPALSHTYSATTEAASTLNDAEIAVSAASDIGSVTGSRKLNEMFESEYKGKIKVRNYIPSLALRIAMVASGEIDAAFARAGANDWDVAAADLILRQAGGNLIDADGNYLSYNRENVRVPSLVACAEHAQKQVMTLVKQGKFLQ